MKARPSQSAAKKSLVSTFTYFIPAPPHRKSGYREREFDKIMQGILQSGFELMNLSTQAVDSGLFVVAVIKAKDKKVALLDSNLDLHDKFRLAHAHSSPDIVLDEDDDV